MTDRTFTAGVDRQTWILRTQLDVMRTVCYRPGPLVMPDLGEFSMDAEGKE
jgi:glycerophosphoryl diester phosphodiesterase/phosphatidylglycerol phospholipase C